MIGDRFGVVGVAAGAANVSRLGPGLKPREGQCAEGSQGL